MQSTDLEKARNYLRHAEYIDALLRGENRMGYEAIHTTGEPGGYPERRTIHISGLSSQRAGALLEQILPMVEDELRKDAADARELAKQLILEGFELRQKGEGDQ